MPRTVRMALAVAGALVIGLAGCGTGPGAPAGRTDRDCITDFEPGTDYFPDKSTVSDATNFTLDYHHSYQVLTVREPYPGGAPQSYLLVRCGAPDPQPPGELAHAPRITVPVGSLYSGSTTQLGMFAELDDTAVVTGIAAVANVVDATVRARIDAGDVVDFAPGGQLNTELVVAEQPGVLLTQGLDDPGHQKLRDAGIPVVAGADWLEAPPLGRAEWIKVIAALTGTERRAGEVYRRLRDDYRALADTAAGAPPVPVLTGTMAQGTRSMPTGGDYPGRLILDAGGDYPWARNVDRTRLQLNFESVYTRAGQARVWLVDAGWASTADALAVDPRYGQLAAVRDGQVWSADKTLGPTGGNDYWERGPARPDLVLADLIAILHPGLLGEHRFEFYRQVPGR